MPRATCRCGQALTVPATGDGRIVCPKCGARVRVRRRGAVAAEGVIRFFCPCGRRLKVDAASPPSHGQCPACGRVVPIPDPAIEALPPGHPESPTAELDPVDREALEAWSRYHEGRAEAPRPPGVPAGSTAEGPQVAQNRSEAGLRVCPNCGRPVHLGAEACRHCGILVPRR